jgi:hypothetical protein
MDCHGFSRVRQNHRFAKAELSDDATQSFQQRDSTKIGECILRIGEDQQRRKRVLHVNNRADMAAKINLSGGDSQRYFIEDGSRAAISR